MERSTEPFTELTGRMTAVQAAENVGAALLASTLYSTTAREIANDSLLPQNNREVAEFIKGAKPELETTRTALHDLTPKMNEIQARTGLKDWRYGNTEHYRFSSTELPTVKNWQSLVQVNEDIKMLEAQFTQQKRLPWTSDYPRIDGRREATYSSANPVGESWRLKDLATEVQKLKTAGFNVNPDLAARATSLAETVERAELKRLKEPIQPVSNLICSLSGLALNSALDNTYFKGIPASVRTFLTDSVAGTASVALCRKGWHAGLITVGVHFSNRLMDWQKFSPESSPVQKYFASAEQKQLPEALNLEFVTKKP